MKLATITKTDPVAKAVKLRAATADKASIATLVMGFIVIRWGPVVIHSVGMVGFIVIIVIIVRTVIFIRVIRVTRVIP